MITLKCISLSHTKFIIFFHVFYELNYTMDSFIKRKLSSFTKGNSNGFFVCFFWGFFLKCFPLSNTNFMLQIYRRKNMLPILFPTNTYSLRWQGNREYKISDAAIHLQQKKISVLHSTRETHAEGAFGLLWPKELIFNLQGLFASGFKWAKRRASRNQPSVQYAKRL